MDGDRETVGDTHMAIGDRATPTTCINMEIGDVECTGLRAERDR